MRAFLSSTFWDLRPERTAALGALKSLSLELEAMEWFIAKPTEPLKAVLDNLRRCDFVVLLIGSRAGSLVPKRKGLTFTQAEYRLARQLKLPIFVFVKTNRGKWRNREVKGTAKYLSLDKFHRTATTHYLPKYFPSPQKLRKQVKDSLTDWDAQGRPGARRIFSTPQQFFRSDISGRTLLDYEQTLRGRSKQQKEFHDFIRGSKKTVALLKGRGGIGKTKLLHEWSGNLKGWKIFCVNEAAHWHHEAFKELPNGKVLLIHDDAHRSEILRELAVLTRDLRPGSIKLLLAYRPSGSHLVEASISRFFGPELIFQMTPLEQLSHTDVRKIAAEVLGKRFRQYTEPLAIVSRDTPLVTVVGGKLIARRQIPPKLLANEDAFRRTVFDRFIAEQQGQLPGLDINVRPFLDLLAAVAPISLDSTFLTKAEEFLKLRSDQLLRASDALVQGGLLLKGGSLIRIVPDVLSDFVLERACVASTGESTQFADAVYDQFGDEFLSSFLRNLGELDWRISRRASSTSILEKIWSRIRARFNSADAFERKALLESIKPAASVQPAPCLDLVRIALADEAKPTVTLISDFSYTQKDVLAQLPPILGGMAYDFSYTRIALRLLWNLSKGPKGRTDAAKMLESVGSYDRYKPIAYNKIAADFLTEIMTEPDGFAGEFTPLDIADKLLAKEGDFSEFEGMAFHIGAFILNFENIAPVRKVAFAALKNALFSESAKIGVRAVASIDHVITQYLPRLRNALTPDEARWQSRERAVGLALLADRVRSGPPAVAVLRQIRHVLRRLEKRPHQNSGTLKRVRAILAEIRTAEVDIFDAFISSPWQFDQINDKGEFLSGDSARKAQVQHAWELLQKLYPTAGEKVEELERLYSWLRESGLENGAHLEFVGFMCKQDNAFCCALAEFIIGGDPSDQVAWTLQMVLRNLLLDSSAYASVAIRATEHKNLMIVRSAASSLFFIRADEVTGGELMLLKLLASKSDQFIKTCVLSGLKWLAKDAKFLSFVISTALLVDLSGDKKIADEFCEVFGPFGANSASIDRNYVKQILDRLVEIENLDEYHCQQLLMLWTNAYPEGIFEFFLRRIDISLEKRAAGNWRFDAVPRGMSLRKVASGSELIRKLRAVIDKFIEANCEREWSKFFWALTVFDEPAIQLLEEYVQIQDEVKIRAIIALLQDAPREIPFNYPQFTKKVLEEAEKISSQYRDSAMSLFIYNCHPGAFVGGSGSGALTRIVDLAKARMQEYIADPLLHPLYKSILDSIEKLIQNLQISEADMQFEHS